MELSSVFGGDTLKATDLQGNEPVVKIAKVEMKKFDNGNKLIVSFADKKKALVCNKTNANRIARLHGTDTDGWLGKEIMLYTDMVDFQGQTVDAIRVRAAPKRAPIDDQRQAAIADVAAPARGDMDDEIPF